MDDSAIPARRAGYTTPAGGPPRRPSDLPVPARTEDLLTAHHQADATGGSHLVGARGRGRGDGPRRCTVSWCELPGGHDDGRARCEHARVVSDDVELGAVTLTRTDAGPLTGPVLVRLSGAPATLTVPQFVDLVDGLLLARAELGSLPGLLDDGPTMREAAAVLADAGRLLAEQVRGPGAGEVLARIDAVCARVGVAR